VPGRGVNHIPPTNAEVKERVELHISNLYCLFKDEHLFSSVVERRWDVEVRPSVTSAQTTLLLGTSRLAQVVGVLSNMQGGSD
jgi:hypothetical protein